MAFNLGHTVLGVDINIFNPRQTSIYVRRKSILKKPKLDEIKEEDEDNSNRSTPLHFIPRKLGFDNSKERLNSDPEADQIDLNHRTNDADVDGDMVDGVTFAPLPNDEDENEFEKKTDKNKLPRLKIIRILGGLFLSLAIMAVVITPLSIHYFAKERKISYLYYKLPADDKGIMETHIIQVV